ncbi:hypothetical protein AAG906_003234 [Vitis piasezkii]
MQCFVEFPNIHNFLIMQEEDDQTFHHYMEEEKICYKISHIVVQCFYRFDQEFQASTYTTNNQSMIAMLATLEVVTTNHYTPTIDNLTNKSTYDGHDQVHMSNGESEPISHIGKAFLHLSSSPCVFHLKNLLHISHLTKNLICVSKFSQDNKVFEFHLDICFAYLKMVYMPFMYSSPQLAHNILNFPHHQQNFNKSNYTTTLSR